MKDLPLPGGCKSKEEFSAFIHRRIEECMKDYKNKEETMQHLSDHFQIPRDLTSIVWDLLEATYPEDFRSHYESCETERRIREATTMHSYKLIPRFFRGKREMIDETSSQAPQESALLPRGLKSVEEYRYYVHGRIMQCMRHYKSKEETIKHLLDQHGIAPESTKTMWDYLEQGYSENFRSYYEACERNRKLREQEAPKVMANTQKITEETGSSSTSVASKTLILIRGLKDMKVKNQEEQRTCPPGKTLKETGSSSKVSRLESNAEAKGQKVMNLEQLLLLLNSSRDGAKKGSKREVTTKKHRT